MIVVVPAPKDDNASDATVDYNLVMVRIVASAMSRNAMLLSSTWTAV
jgi:hypothetical protein